MKYFTVEEAEALLPELETIFARTMELHAKAERKAARVRELDESGENPAEAALERGRVQFLLNRVEEQLRRVLELGAVPKGLDPALVDFPYRLGDREVYLCWQRGERTITHYHGLEDGFGGRKRLPRTSTK